MCSVKTDKIKTYFQHIVYINILYELFRLLRGVICAASVCYCNYYIFRQIILHIGNDTSVSLYSVLSCICTIAGIEFDRYARIRYLNTYTGVVTKNRVVLACIAIAIYSLRHATLFAAGIKYNFFNTSRRFAATLDILIIIFITFVYLYIVKIIKDHRRSITHDLLKSVNQKITTLASKILLPIGIFYGIYAVAKVIHFLLKTKIKGPAR